MHEYVRGHGRTRRRELLADMQKISKICTLLILSAAVAVGTAGCDPRSPLGELSLSVDQHGGALLGVCMSSEVDDIFVSYRPKVGSEWSRVLEANGSPTIVEPGDTWRVDGEIFGFHPQLDNSFPLVGGSEVDVGIAGVGESHSLNGWFSIPEQGLRQGEWLFSDGSTSDKVCGDFAR